MPWRAMHAVAGSWLPRGSSPDTTLTLIVAPPWVKPRHKSGVRGSLLRFHLGLDSLVPRNRRATQGRGTRFGQGVLHLGHIPAIYIRKGPKLSICSRWVER